MLTLFPPFTTIVVCSLICLYALHRLYYNIMDSDQTAPLVERARMLKVFWNASEHAADIIKRQLFHDDKTY